MASESLPKFMFLHEDSQEMNDKRIRTLQTYIEAGDKTEKIAVKRVHNTIPTKHKPNSKSIFNLEYSNKYGILLQATEDEVLIIDQQQLQADLLKGSQNGQSRKKIEFAGEVFLSPSEETLAVCSESLIQLLKMKQIPAISCPPIAKKHQHHRFLWISESHILLWGFLNTAKLLTINPETFEKVSQQDMEKATQCTGASIIGTSLLICQKMKILIYQLGDSKLKKTIDMHYQDHKWMYYDYSYIIQVFRVNVHKSPQELNTRLKVPFEKEDILGIVLVYYDDEAFEENERVLTFYRGNLLDGGKDIRGSQNFYTAQNKPQYYWEENQMLPFSVKVAYVGCFICIMFQRSSTVYIVDPFEKFEVINIFSPPGKLDFKAQGKFFQGMGILKKLLPFQKKIPEDVKNQLLEKIIKDFNGQFMTLYFVDQETNLTIPFPASIIAITEDNLYRRYAVSSLGGIDKDRDEDILTQIQKIKKSPYLIESKKQIQTNEERGKQRQKNKEEAKKQEKKQGTNSLFNVLSSQTVNFTTSLFGGPKINAGTTLNNQQFILESFPKSKNVEDQKKISKEGNIFEANKQKVPSINQNLKNQTPSSNLSSLFNKNQSLLSAAISKNETKNHFSTTKQLEQQKNKAVLGISNQKKIISDSAVNENKINKTRSLQSTQNLLTEKQIEESNKSATIKKEFQLQSLKQKVNSFKDYLNNFKSSIQINRFHSLQQLKSFSQNLLKEMKNPQSLCLGGPLAKILEKAQLARENYIHYQKILNAACKQIWDEKEIEIELASLQNKLTKGLYFNGYLNLKNGKKVNSGAIYQKERKKLNFLLDEFYGKMDLLKESTEDLKDNIIKQEVQIQKRRSQKIMNKSSIKKSKVFNFNEFCSRPQIQDENIKADISEIHEKIRISQNTENNIKKKNTIMIVNVSGIKQSPKCILPEFDVKIKNQPINKEKIQQKNVVSQSQLSKRLTTQPSFNTISQSKVSESNPSKSKEKVVIPIVKTTNLQLQENQAISETLENSQSDDNLPLPGNNRQISKIQGPPKQSGLSLFENTSSKEKNQQNKSDEKSEKKQDKKSKISLFVNSKSSSVGPLNLFGNQNTVIKQTQATTNKKQQLKKDEKKEQITKISPVLNLGDKSKNKQENDQKNTTSFLINKSSEAVLKNIFSETKQIQDNKQEKKVSEDPVPKINRPVFNIFNNKNISQNQTDNSLFGKTNQTQQQVKTVQKLNVNDAEIQKQQNAIKNVQSKNLVSFTSNTASLNTNQTGNIPNKTNFSSWGSQQSKPVFGGPNRFMQSPQQDQQIQAAKTGFDPNAMSFGGGSLGLKTFTSFGGQQNGNVFSHNTYLGQQNQQLQQRKNMNPQQSKNLGGVLEQNNNLFNDSKDNYNKSGNFQQGNTMFNNSMGQGNNMFGNFNQGNLAGNTYNSDFLSSEGKQTGNIVQNSSIFQGNKGIFGQSNSMFTQNNNVGNQGGNFLQGFIQKAPTNAPAGINPSLLAPRK